MVLPANINAGTPDPAPSGVFLIPLCTTQEGLEAMLRALDAAYAQSRNLQITKDFLNALQFINNPSDAICMNGVQITPDVEIEMGGDCQRVLVNGVPVTDWICKETIRQAIEQPIGTLGFTLSELEEIAMGCLNLNDSLKWENGILYMRTCDGWQPVPGIASPVQTASGNAAAALDLDAWVASGQPELNEPDIAPHENEFFVTMDSLKCAKATAIVDEIWNVLTIGEAVRDASSFATFLSGVGASLAGLGWIPGAAAALVGAGLGLANAIWAIVTGSTFSEYADEMDDVYSNTTGKSALICDLVPRMKSPTMIGNLLYDKMTAADVKIAIERFEAILSPTNEVKKTVRVFPVQGWIDVVSPKVRAYDCGCSQYLPYSYTPPVASGLQILFKEYGFASGGANASNGGFNIGGITGNPYESIYASGRTGTLTAGKHRTVFAGTDTSGGGGTHYNSRAMLVFESSQSFELTEYKVIYSYPDGDPIESGTGGTHYRGQLQFDETTGLWAGVAGGNLALGTENPASNIVQSALLSWVGVKRFAIGVGIRHTGSHRRAQIEDILFTGIYAGQGFTDLSLGAVFNP